MQKMNMSRLANALLVVSILVVGVAKGAVQGTSWRQPVPNSVQTTASARLDALYVAGCQPFKAKGVDYNGCAGDAPPPLDDVFQTALSRGFKGSREDLIEACKSNANLCVVDPILHDCPTGTVWSQAGGAPHCVRVDPTCNSGYQVAKDALGNPSCQVVTAPCTPGPITVTGSCAAYYGAGTWSGTVYYTRDVTCPGNIKGPKVYDSDTCVNSSVPSCQGPDVTTGSCGSGFTGSTTITTTYSGASCTGTTTTDRSQCVAIPSCQGPDVTAGSCGSGFTGSTTITTTYSGASCTPKTTTDRSQCVPVTPCPGPDVTAGSCGSGFTGSTTITTTYSGASCTPKTTVDRSQCSPVTPCPDTDIKTGSCGSGFTGNTSIITTFSGASCTPLTTTDRSQCVPCSAPLVSYSACDFPNVGQIVTTTTYSGVSCTASTVVDKSGCKKNGCVPYSDGGKLSGTICDGEVIDLPYHWHSTTGGCWAADGQIVRSNGVSTITHGEKEHGRVIGSTCVLF